MKLRVTLALPDGGLHDITLSCDVTATVADTARALLRAGAGSDARMAEIASTRFAPVTLQGRPHAGAPAVLLDPAAPVGASGLQSGWIIAPVLEFGAHDAVQRVVEVAGTVEVLSGPQTGVLFSLVAGRNTIGRDTGCRIHLHDPSVSRRHAVLDVGATTVMRDLGSANGTLVDGHALSEHRLSGPCTVTLGEVTLRVIPGPPTAGVPDLTHRAMHTRAPRVTPRFPASERELPTPPAPSAPSRIPMLAMLAPMMMGGVMYAVTQSPMSLIMVAFSPLMMIGSWTDNALGRTRKLRRELRQFETTLAVERDELLELRDREIRVRAAETPTLPEVAEAITERTSLLWARRPEHRSFLEVRFGEGALPSRTAVGLPPRGEAQREQWDALRGIEEEFRTVVPVPVLERFDRCGSIGVAGEPLWAAAMVRSLVLQVIGLHSPAEVTLTCFAGRHHTEEWSWLKWVPHIDSVTSPLRVGQLADNAASSARLLVALEGLLETRLTRAAPQRTVRSHLDVETRNDAEQGEAVGALPTTPAVIVLVLDDGLVDPSRLIALAESGPDVGIHLIWLSRSPRQLPAACRTFVELGAGDGTVNFVRSGATVPLHRVEFVEAAVALDLARRLAPVEDTSARVLDESDLPRAVNLRDLHPTDLLGGSQPIMQAWANAGTLTSQWRLGVEREPLSLNAVVGQGPDGPAKIDLRSHGPHALVGGTTGAGKSEFLQSWIMSMAARISPDRLSFLLVDYKGGAAFAECTDLPHTVGLVTDLSPHLVRRALTSLRAELRHREELLATHGAKDLITMERRSDPAAPPALLIVIDEFAALARDVPEFVDGVVDIAQRGRSLGLHLVMATQRPAGVITDNLRANTNLRIALRMADESDSRDVIGVTDAAFFGAETPGRGAIKVGPGQISHFQTGYVGGRASSVVVDSRLEVRSLDFAEGAPWNVPPEPIRTRGERVQHARDIERLRDGVIGAAEALRLAAPRRPWLDALPDALDLRTLRPRDPAPERSRGRDGDRVNDLGSARDSARGSTGVGVRDVPSAQAQRTVHVDLEGAGNVAFVGAGGTGKTTAVITLAAALSMSADTAPVALYVIDAAGGALDALSALPTVGAVAPLSDTELVARMLQKALDLIAERGPRYAAARAASLDAYRRTPGGQGEPRVVLIIDGFAAFRQSTETLGGITSPFHMLNEIMLTGRAVGVHVVLTADRSAAIPASMVSNVQQQFVFRLASAHDYGQLGVPGDTLDEAPAGRAVLAGESDELQIALLDGERELAGQARAVDRLSAELRARGVRQVDEVRNAPERVPLSGLPREHSGRPVCGIDTRTFAPVTMPTTGLGVISGPAGSGQSTAALSCVEALERWAEARDTAVESALLTFTRDGVRSARDWSRVACGEEDVASLSRHLILALGGRLPKTSGALFGAGTSVIGGPIGGPIRAPEAVAPRGEPPDSPGIVFPGPGRHGVVVVERPAEAEGTEAFPLLVALAKAARRADVLVLFEFEQGTAQGIWDLFSALKQPSWGVALQPDEGESQTPFRESFGRVTRASFPPGRGFAVERGRVQPVHFAQGMGCSTPPEGLSHA